MSCDASKLRVLPAGDRALLLTPGDREDLDGLVDLLRGAELTGMQDLLPAAQTVLLTLAAGADAETVERELRQLLATTPTTRSGSEDAGDPLTIPVRYDGADLDDVAPLLDISVEELVARHTGRVWRCRFIGFTAGFGYLGVARLGLVSAAAPAIANLGTPGLRRPRRRLQRGLSAPGTGRVAAHRLHR